MPTTASRPTFRALLVRSSRSLVLKAAIAAAILPAFALSAKAADAVLTYLNGTNNWSTPSAWTPIGIPNNGTKTFDAVFNGNYYANSADTLTLNINVTLEKFTLADGFLLGPTLGSPTTLTLNDSLKWTSGIIGRSNIIARKGGVIAANLTCTLNNATLENFGVLTYTSTFASTPDNQLPLRLDPSGVIINHAGATFDIAGDSGISVTSSTARIDNQGLWIKSAGTGVSQIKASLNDTGTLRVSSGTLEFIGGLSTHSGVVDVAAGATLYLDDSMHTFTPTATLGGDGILRFASNDLEFNGKLLGGGGILQISKGQTHFNAGSDVAPLGLSTAAGGRALQLTVQGTTSFDTGHSVSIASLSSDSNSITLTGADDLTLTGPVTWTGGTVLGPLTGAVNTLAVNGGLSISGLGLNLEHRKLQNNSTITWTGGYIEAKSGAIIENSADATFDIKTDTRLEWGPTHTGSPLPLLNNAGLIVKSAGTGITEIDDVRLVNTGTVRVETGTLTLFHSGPGAGLGFADTGVNSGIYEISQGAMLSVSEHVMDALSIVRGAGTMEFRGNTNTVKGQYNITGQTSAQGVVAFQSGATVTNVGQLITIALHASASFDTGNPVQFHDVNVDGTLAGTDPITFDGNLSGSGTITAANLFAGGNISPGNSPGTLSIKSKLIMQASARLTIELSKTSSDLLATSGGLTVDGNLVLHLLNGYVPTASDRFTIATSTTAIAGLFDNVLPGGRVGTPEGYSFAVNYGSTSAFGSTNIVLNNFRVPEPASAAILILSAPFLLGRRHRKLSCRPFTVA